MPTVIDYPIVLDRLRGQGMRSHYYNSGAFGLADAANMRAVAWALAEDPTIRESARGFVRLVTPATVEQLARLAGRLWLETITPGQAVWVMPMAHWAFELDHDHRAWMPDALRSIGVDPEPLAAVASASAIAFEPGEVGTFERFLVTLLSNLKGSDFALAFPGRNVLCTVHHHQQLWWMTTEAGVIEAAEGIVGK